MTTTAPASDAERMDRHYRFQRYIYDATRTHYLLGRRHLIRQLAPPPRGTVLEIGCGTAWNLVRAAKGLSAVALSRPRRLQRHAGYGAHLRCPPWAPRSGRPSPGRRDRVFGQSAIRHGGVRPRIFLLCADDDPGLEGRARTGGSARPARRLAAHRRFRSVRRTAGGLQEGACSRFLPTTRSIRATDLELVLRDCAKRHGFELALRAAASRLYELRGADAAAC